MSLGARLVAGLGALVLGLGLGAALGGESDTATPTDRVPITFAEPETTEPVEQTIYTLPEERMPAAVMVTGPRSYDTLVYLTQDGDQLTFDVVGEVFTGEFDQSDGSFHVENARGTFDGLMEGDRMSGDHVFEGDAFTFEGILEQPLVEETVTEPLEPAATFAGTIGDGFAFQPAGTADGGGFGALGFVGLGLLAAGGLIVFAGGPAPGEVEVHGAEGGILEGFAGMSAPPKEKAPSTVGWDGAIKIWKGHQDELVDDFGSTLNQFKDDWVNAMTSLDEYKDTFNHLVSASTDMKGLLVAFEEEQAIREKQDLAFAVATLVVGGYGLVKSGYKAFSSLKAAWKGGGNVAEFLSRMPPAEAGILKSLAKEAGADLGETLTKHGGDVGAAMQELFYTVFNKRGWHYLGETAVMVDASVYTVDVSATVGKVVANTHAGLATLAKGSPLSPTVTKQLWHDVAVLKEIAKKDPRFIESLKTAVIDVVVKTESQGMMSIHGVGTQGLVEAISFARATGNLKEVAKLEKLLAAAEKSATATVKLLDDADFSLLEKILDSGGDLDKLGHLLGPAGVEGLSSGFKVGKWSHLFSGPGMGSVALTSLALAQSGGALDGQAFDIGKFADAFGIVEQGKSSFFGIYGSVLWGFITSPFVTYGKVTNTLQGLERAEDFLDNHGQDLVRLSGSLQQAAFGLGQVAKDLDASGLEKKLQDAAAKLDGDVLDLQRSLGGLSSREQQEKKEQLDAIRKEIGQKITAIGDTIAQLQAAANTAKSLSQLFDTWAKSKGLFTLDPQINLKVQIARALLLGMMHTINTSPIPGGATPPGWGFSQQIEAEMKSWMQAHGK